MIFESRFWKAPLARRAKELRRQLDQKRWREASFAKLERNVLLGFYEVRRLIEAGKLSSQISDSRHRLISHRSLGKTVHRLNWHSYWELYDLERGTEVEKDLLFLCHQFVHSYVFIAFFSEAELLEGVLVSSDRKRNHQAYLVHLSKIIEIFELVSADDPQGRAARFNEKKGDFEFVDACPHCGSAPASPSP